jgi:hypothetical protein
VHRHLWIDNPAAAVTDPDNPAHAPDAALYACQDCHATAEACTTCGRVSETGRTCQPCVDRAREDLRQIQTLYRQLPDVIAAIAGLHAIRYDQAGRGGGGDTRITGGAAMVLAADGNANGTRLGRGETTIDPALIDAERHDPPSVLAALAFWEDTWRVELRKRAATTTSVGAAARFLLSNTSWAAQNSPTWDEYRADIRDLLHRLRVLTGDVRTPVRAGVPCPYCAGQVVQHWTTTGLGDIRVCDQCGIQWATEAHFLLAISAAHKALPQTHPDLLVTLDDAKRIYRGRVRANTLDKWVARGSVQPAVDERGRPRRNVRGEPLYRLGLVEHQLTTGEAAS